MLPNRNDAAFPTALCAAREAKKLNKTQLANIIGIEGAMIGRYENINHSCYGKPSQKTWEKLNNVLFSDVDLTVTNLYANNTGASQPKKALKDASFEEIISELKLRGAVSVQVHFSK